MDVLVVATNPKNSAAWPPEKRLTRWARVMEWHDYARDLHERGKLPWAWGLRQLMETTKPTAVDHGVVGIYRVGSLHELTRLLDEDPLREVSEYMSVPLTSLEDDFADDNGRFDRAKKSLFSDDPVAMIKFAEYEAVTAKAPSYVGKWQPRMPANPPVDFDRLSEPGDPLQLLVYGCNPDSYIDSWDDLKHLMHYQKVLWWHHYTWMLTHQGVKTHAWGTHDYCTASYSYVGSGAKSAAAMDIFTVPDLEGFSELFALDPIREDSLYQVALLRPIAEQRLADERRISAAMVRTGTTLAWRPTRVPATV